MAKKYDFSGWATKANVRCTDGRIILPNAFEHQDGQQVPLIWNHDRSGPDRVLGHALLENRPDGVYAYCTFNDTESGQTAKKLVHHGDVTSLSIWANKLKEHMSVVQHGVIREVSLVLAGANPEAYINNVVTHSDDGEDIYEIWSGEYIDYISHSDEDDETLAHADEDKDEKEEKSVKDSTNNEKSVKEVIESMTEEQQKVMYALIGEALEHGDMDEDDDDDEDEDDEDIEEDDEEEDEEMKHNVFDKESQEKKNTLSHADGVAILELAKKPGTGSLKQAIAEYVEANSLEHSVFTAEDTESLFPEFELLKKGEPETLERDQSWIGYVMNKIHKSPISRIRTRYADARIAELKAKGYNNREEQKKVMAQVKMAGRTTDPQTIYIKSDMHRDDIIDITDFDVVAYQWKLMRHILNEELALAALIGDGREDDDADKIKEDHIRSVWHDDEIYTIHADVDFEAAKAELQGTNTGANFSDNYIMAEAVIRAALYAREQYKGSGNLDFYCTPHALNIMLLSRDLNGRRIYSSKADLAAALNVNAIHTVEQFENKTRVDKDGKTKKLFGIFVNMADYQFGSTKGGEITKFEDFDMDFNKYKYMLETRLSGSLTKLYSAIALEETVEASAEG